MPRKSKKRGASPPVASETAAEEPKAKGANHGSSVPPPPPPPPHPPPPAEAPVAAASSSASDVPPPPPPLPPAEPKEVRFVFKLIAEKRARATGDIRRMALAEGDAARFDKVWEAAKALFPDAAALCYIDEDGDRVTIATQSDLDAALHSPALTPSCLRLIVTQESPKWFDTRNPVGSLRAAVNDPELADLRLVLKEDVRKPLLLAKKDVFEKLVARERALKDLLLAFQERAKLFKEDRSSLFKNKARALYTATSGSPGTGKSRILDEAAKFGSLSSEILREMAAGAKLEDKFLALVRGWIPINVTYNAEMRTMEAGDIEHFFCLRVLASYLFESFSFSTLQTWARPKDQKLSIAPTLRAILADFTAKNPGEPEPTIFLGADEVIKDGAENARTITELIRNACIDHRVFALISTLDVALSFQEASFSDRLISWIDLRPPNQDEAAVLVAPESLGTSAIVDPSDQDAFHTFLKSIRFTALASDCNGHFRTLEELVLSAKALVSEKGSELQRTISWGDVFSKLQHFLSSGFPCEPPLALLRLVLLGKSENLDKQIAQEHTLLWFVKSGVLSNDLKSASPFDCIVPRVPLIKLHFWAANKATTVSEPDVRSLARMLVAMISDSQLDWAAMETFHSCWEGMRCILEPGKHTTLAGHYQNGRGRFRCSNSSLGRLAFKYPPAHSAVLRGTLFSSSLESPTVHVGGTTSNPWDIEALRELDVPVRSGKLAPTFALIIEVKHSHEDAKTSINTSEIERKATNCVSALLSPRGKEWCKVNRVQKVCLVVVASRNICRGALSNAVSKIVDLKKELVGGSGKAVKTFGVVVLTRECLKMLYGETLGVRVDFLARVDNESAGYHPSASDEAEEEEEEAAAAAPAASSSLPSH